MHLGLSIKHKMRAYTNFISATHPILHFAHPTLESFIWNTLIRHYVQNDPSNRTHLPISIYIRMRHHGVKPDFHTFPFLLQSFNDPSHFHLGQQAHSHILLFGLTNDPFIQTSLINMYSSCGNLSFARHVFDEIVNPDLPSWNSMVKAYVKFGLIGVARDLFDIMPVRNVISWSCMVNGYVSSGEYKEAISAFRDMLMPKPNEAEVKPNEFIMSAVLSACGRLGALEQGKWAHAYIDKCNMKIDFVLGTSLIDMYAKCGSIERAKLVFNTLGPNKDLKAYSAMISGLAMHGRNRECLELFSEMTGMGIKPNYVTFLGVLCSCVHGGLIEEGETYFRLMSEGFGISPTIQHYGCMVDLYGRAGLIEKAWNLISSMPMEPDVLVWGSLLSGSRMCGDIKTCEIAVKKLIELEPSNSAAYVLLSNVYAKTGGWKEARQIRDVMDAKRIKKEPGCSLVELGGILHEFFVGDDSHPETREIYLMLDEIMKNLKRAGYVSDTKYALLDLDEEGKEIALTYHSEKLAVAFCILKTRTGTPIRIIKNLRICGDCHVAMKMISRIYGREIVVRDCNRFHHFRDGSCSCRDYW